MRPIIAFLLILLSIGIFYLLTQPVLADITAVKARSALLDDVITNGRKLLKVRDDRRDELLHFPPDIRANLEKMLPDRIDNVRLIIDLIALALRYGIDVRNPQIVEPGTAKSTAVQVGPDVNRYGSVDLAFSFQAPYGVFQKFLEDMEHSLRLLDVVSVEFSANDKDNYDYTVTIRTYWLK